MELISGILTAIPSVYISFYPTEGGLINIRCMEKLLMDWHFNPVINYGFGLDFPQSDLLARIEIQVDLSSPVITSGPSAQSDNGASAVINWSTDEPANSIVRYGLSSSYGITTTVDVFETLHAVTINQLSPAQIYHYSVCSQDLPGNEPTCSADYTFQTASQTAPNILDSMRAKDYGTRGMTIANGALWTIDYPNLLYKVDMSSGDILDFIRFSVGEDMRGLAWDGNAFWFAEDDFYSSEKLVKVDPGTGNVLKTINSPGRDPKDVDFAGGYLWVLDGSSRTLYKVDPNYGNIVSSFSTSAMSNPTCIATNGENVWLYSFDNRLIYKTTTNGVVLGTYPAPGEVRRLDWDESSSTLWLKTYDWWYYQMSTTPTYAPVVAKVLVNGYGTGIFRAGSNLRIEAQEQFERSGYQATVTISSATDDPQIVNAPMVDAGNGKYYYDWNTAGRRNASDYHIEVRMTDGIYSDEDGISRSPDALVILAPTLSVMASYAIHAPTVKGIAWAGVSILDYKGYRLS